MQITYKNNLENQQGIQNLSSQKSMDQIFITLEKVTKKVLIKFYTNLKRRESINLTRTTQPQTQAHS